MPDPNDFAEVLKLIQFVDRLKQASNEDVANTLLDHAPVMGALAHVCEEAAERLSPGIIQRRWRYDA